MRSLHRNAKLYLVYTAFNSIGFSIFSLVFNLYVHSLGFGADFIGLVNALPSIAVLLLRLPVVAAGVCWYDKKIHGPRRPGAPARLCRA